MSRHLDRPAWDTYIREFHRRRPGITEAVLSRCVDADGSTPYAWLVAGIEPTSRVLDVARSPTELARARSEHDAMVVHGDASALPVQSRSVDVVIVSMALMLIDPLGEALAEIHRVLVAGGELRALLPTTSPMTIRDRWTYARLATAARSIPRFPPTPLHHNLAVLDDARLTVTDDERRRFTHHLGDATATRRFVDSWYTAHKLSDAPIPNRRGRQLPNITAVTVPLRRIIARRA
jgi:SAM-dependent methyltransferase